MRVNTNGETEMAGYNVAEIAAKYKEENGRMYAGAYEWMIAEIQRLTRPTVGKRSKAETAAKKVLRNPGSRKKAKTAAGSALSQPMTAIGCELRELQLSSTRRRRRS